MAEKESREVESPTRRFLGEIGRSLAEAAKASLLWTLIGATIGALAIGGLGARYFGWSGLGIGLLAGALIGALAVWWLYASA